MPNSTIDPELVELWVQSWKATRSDIDFEARRGWFIGHMENLHDGGARILRADGPEGLQGFATIHPITGYMDQLAVRPDAFGTGVGDRLIALARRNCPGRIDLLVNQDNFRAIRFYQRVGFVITGEAETKIKLWSMTWTPTRDSVEQCKSI
jgi:putative acetyltransferase